MVLEQSFGGQVVPLSELQAYQHFNPDVSTVQFLKNLAADNPHHPPLYFLLARLWVQYFGDSITALRSLSAVFSVFSLPLMYWLCRALFSTPLAGEVAIALVAVSPFHVLYAQEARPYSLWILTILASSLALLRALRSGKTVDWGLYGVSAVLSLYTALFSLFVIVGHGLYVAILERGRLTQRLSRFLVTFVGIIAAFSPWLVVIFNRFSDINQATSWTSQSISFATRGKIWLLNAVRIFFDIDFSFRNPFTYLSIFVLVLIPYALYFLLRHAKVQNSAFVLTLVGVLACTLIGADLGLGGIRSTTIRYILPCFLGIQLAVIYLLSTKLDPLQSRRLWIGKILTLVVLSLGVFSNVWMTQSESWWNKYSDVNNLAIAERINAAQNPVLMTFNGSTGQILSLSHSLDSDVRLRLFLDANLKTFPDEAGEIFLLDPPASLRENIEQQRQETVAIAHSASQLWRINP